MSSRIDLPVRVNLVHNPAAGDGLPSAQDLLAMLTEAGLQVRYASTKKDWKKALGRPADMAVAAGGDGTAAKVLKQLAGSQVPVALLPIGTANNVGRSLGISGDLRKLIPNWHSGRRRPFDLGILDTGDGRRSVFVEACGGGPVATAVERGKEAVEQSSTLLGNEIDRALSFLRDLVEEAPLEHWLVEIDGRDYSGDYIGVEALNIRFAGPGVPLAPSADSSDGLLDFVLIEEGDRQKLIDYLERRLAHEAHSPPELRVVQGATARITPPSAVLRVDDQLRHELHGPVEVTIWPGAATVLAPA